MPKKQNINSSRRNFLAGSATVAGAAAAASVMPISIANANHTAADAKGLPSWTSWKRPNAFPPIAAAASPKIKRIKARQALTAKTSLTMLRHAQSEIPPKI